LCLKADRRRPIALAAETPRLRQDAVVGQNIRARSRSSTKDAMTTTGARVDPAVAAAAGVTRRGHTTVFSTSRLYRGLIGARSEGQFEKSRVRIDLGASAKVVQGLAVSPVVGSLNPEKTICLSIKTTISSIFDRKLRLCTGDSTNPYRRLIISRSGLGAADCGAAAAASGFGPRQIGSTAPVDDKPSDRAQMTSPLAPDGVRSWDDRPVATESARAIMGSSSSVWVTSSRI